MTKCRIMWRLASVPVCCVLCFSCRPAENGQPGVSGTAARDGGGSTRIVSMAPNLTEILFALGLDDHIVGVSNFSNYPAAAAAKPRVGGVLNPDIESILALEPDLVVNIPGSASQKVVARLAALGIPTLVVSTVTVEETLDAVETLGERTGRHDEAAVLVQKIRAEFADVRGRVESEPPTKTLFVIGHDPLYVVGDNTFIDDLIEIAGGINIAGDAIGPYPRIGLEDVIARAPEVIIDSTLGTAFPEKDVVTRRRWWMQWDAIPAVATDRIYGLDTDVLLRPGPRMAEAARMVASAIHPDVFDGDTGI